MTAPTHILVVEDERDIAELIALHLKREGYQSKIVENGEEGLLELERQNYQLIVLDWMLPGCSGLDFCRRVRAMSGIVSQIPIVMVTARAQTSDLVVGLETGADDYVTKPFEVPVLLARVRALLRRVERKANADLSVLEVGGLKLDTLGHAVSCDGKPVVLTPSEFKLLEALLRNRGRVLTRDKLIDLVQGEGVTVIDRTVDTHVFGLRKKLNKCADVIETIRGIGYRVKIE